MKKFKYKIHQNIQNFVSNFDYDWTWWNIVKSLFIDLKIINFVHKISYLDELKSIMRFIFYTIILCGLCLLGKTLLPCCITVCLLFFTSTPAFFFDFCVGYCSFCFFCLVYSLLYFFLGFVNVLRVLLCWWFVTVLVSFGCYVTVHDMLIGKMFSVSTTWWPHELSIHTWWFEWWIWWYTCLASPHQKQQGHQRKKFHQTDLNHRI